MEFELDQDQRLLQQVVRETMAKSRSQPADQLWRTYQDLGWLEAPPVELADEIALVTGRGVVIASGRRCAPNGWPPSTRPCA